ncbi:MAG: T9SS type A sorting domain-containing protein [Bacteroidales bacterium]|nr:T9SS type A sorting domain-containing protein [Bacteroidales bacterium]
MKKALLLIVCVAFALAANAQSLGLSYQGNAYQQGDTIEFYANDDIMPGMHLEVLNNTATDQTVYCQVDNLLNNATTVMICAGDQCNPNNVSFPFVVPANGNYDQLVVDFVLNGEKSGLFLCKIYRQDEPTDAIEVVVRLSFGAAIRNVVFPAEVSAYPNPCQGDATIAYSMDANEGLLVVSDLMGRTVMSLPLSEGEGSVSLQGLAKGVYTYAIVAQGRISNAKRLLVR